MLIHRRPLGIGFALAAALFIASLEIGRAHV